MATPYKIKERFSRSKLSCATCRRRKKKCDQLFNAQDVCQICEVGGFECHRDRINSPTIKGTSQFSSFNPQLFPSTTTSSSSSRTPTSSSRAPTAETTSPQPSASAPSAITSAESTPAASCPSLLDSLSTSLTRSSPALLPQSTSNPLLLPPDFTDPSLSLPFNLDADDVFSLLGSLPPAVPPVGFAWSQVVGDMLDGRGVPGGESLGLTGARFRELVDGAEEGVMDEAQEVNETLTLYATLDDEGFSGFDSLSRRLISDRYMTLVCDHDVSTAACMAFASSVRARKLPLTATRARSRLIAQAASFYGKALQDLEMGQYPLEAQLIASMDLSYHQNEIYGPSAYYSSLTLTDILISSALGPRPRPYSNAMHGVLNFLLRGHAYRDVMRSLALGNRSTLFDFSPPPTGGSPLPTFTVFGDITIEGDSTFMAGLPASMVVFLAEMCNLKQEEGGLGKAEIRRRAEELERRILEWKPLERALQEARLEELDSIATREMWRCAALINLRTTLYGLGALHTSLRQALKQLITFGIIPPDPSSLPLPSFSPRISPSAVMERAAPWFFAATVAVSEQDRETCREALRMSEGASTYFAAGNLLHAAERIWELTDTGDGNSIDWRRALEREGRWVSFAWSNA
ncbi:fungal-specific transcription factor domain-domain-containing protein [Leucosporidium creatinivorum]|uniref:Fungal-specific transcription factor domain-domain-containing protein n=1 Tax=Leucosporidium creatinivorum TaxID=106004 RepID=A0A1Y2FBK2_9BASI|nr:fungal-specific transcription factor domain-domain-containing protein [Leucosporidium creatinivorum]